MGVNGCLQHGAGFPGTCSDIGLAGGQDEDGGDADWHGMVTLAAPGLSSPLLKHSFHKQTTEIKETISTFQWHCRAMQPWSS